MSISAKKNAIILFVVILALCVFANAFWGDGKVYETNSISDYGRYVGNYDNDVPSAFINSFFPSELAEYFSSVEYHYKAKKFDTYSYEAYLGFCIEDYEVFQEYVETLSSSYDDPLVFSYDNAYDEYVISDVYSVAPNKEITGKDTYRILSAQLGKILVCHSTQRIIYVAIGHYDGGGTNADELSYFFEKFDIDPIEYTNSSFNSVFEEEQAKR